MLTPLIAFVAAKVIPAFPAAPACLAGRILCIGFGFVARSGCVCRIGITGPAFCFVAAACVVLLLVVYIFYVLVHLAFHIACICVKAILFASFLRQE